MLIFIFTIKSEFV